MSKPSKLQERIANMKVKKATHSPETCDAHSIGIYLNHNGGIDVFDPKNLPASEDQEDLNDIAVAVINAGYEGLRIDESRLSSGKYVRAIAGRMDTYEGQIFQGLRESFERKEPLPSPDEVLALLKISYSLEDKS